MHNHVEISITLRLIYIMLLYQYHRIVLSYKLYNSLVFCVSTLRIVMSPLLKLYASHSYASALIFVGSSKMLNISVAQYTLSRFLSLVFFMIPADSSF